jgi:hypothetical protein
VAGPVRKALDALEALSLGDFEYDLDEKASHEMCRSSSRISG